MYKQITSQEYLKKVSLKCSSTWKKKKRAHLISDVLHKCSFLSQKKNYCKTQDCLLVPLGFEVNMVNPCFLSWNSAASLLVSGNVMFIHITVPAEISVKLHYTYK